MLMLVRHGDRLTGFVDGINARDARTTARQAFCRDVVCTPVNPEDMPDNPCLIGCVTERRQAQIRENNRKRWGE